MYFVALPRSSLALNAYIDGKACKLLTPLSSPSLLFAIPTCIMKLANIAFAASATAVSAQLYGQSNENHTCVLVPDYQSCSPEANSLTVDSCCVETFGGLVLLTQFWDVYTGYESEGQLLPSKNWTIHGLWPDFWYKNSHHAFYSRPCH